MKPLQIAVAGGVFLAVLAGCFIVVGLNGREEKELPASVPLLPVSVPETPLPAPKPPTAALGGFGQVAQLERGYDATAALTRDAILPVRTVAEWALPPADLNAFGDHYHETRLTAERFVGISETEIRVLHARTGQPILSQSTPAHTVALSPQGDWAVILAPGELTILDTTTGATTKIPASTKWKGSFGRAAGFTPENRECFLVGHEQDEHVLYRVQKGRSVVDKVATLHRDGTSKAFRTISHVAALGSGRFLFDRPAEGSQPRQFEVWSLESGKTTPVPVDRADAAEPLQQRISGDGKWLALFTQKKLMVFDLTTNRQIHTLQPSQAVIRGVEFSPIRGRLVLLYDRPESGQTPDEQPTESSYAWVLDVGSKQAIGKKLPLAEIGLLAGCRRMVLAVDGEKVAFETPQGQLRFLETRRGFGVGIVTEARSEPIGNGGSVPTKPVQAGLTDS